MGYEDLEKTRTDRAAKEQAKAKGNGKRGRKPKSVHQRKRKPPRAKENI
jgi:hypothetical protein